MTFSEALELLKDGLPIAREGWNLEYEDDDDDEDQAEYAYLYLVKGSFSLDSIIIDMPEELQAEVDDVEDLEIKLFEKGREGTPLRFPSVNLASDGSIIPGHSLTWIDILSDDWYEVELT